MQNTYKAIIDCPNCASKVENKLKENKDINEVSFDFLNQKLTIDTTLSFKEIEKLAKEVEDDIQLFDNRINHYEFTAEIDCASCAAKVESEMQKNESVQAVSFNFLKKRLTIDTSLSKDQIIKIAKTVEDDIKLTSLENIKDEKKDYALYRIIISVSFFIIGLIFDFSFAFIGAYIIAGFPVLLKAVKNIGKGKIFDENFLMSIATIGALILSSYSEAAAVMIFYLVGEYFQDKAVKKSKGEIASLMDLQSDIAHKKNNEVYTDVHPSSISIGDEIRVLSGEKIPLDGVIVEGSSHLDMRSLTGESRPVEVNKNDKVLSGSINNGGVLNIKVESEFSDSTAQKIIALVEKSSEKRSETEKFISKFSRYYTPFVVFLALAVAILPPLFNLGDWNTWIYRALLLLVVSCPCALVLSVPLSYFAAIGAFAKKGILVKNALAIQDLAAIKSIAFDKTGTLTTGEFKVTSVVNLKGNSDDVLSIAASLDQYSTHPIATAIVEANKSSLKKVENITEIPGKGIHGEINNVTYYLGNSKLFKDVPPTTTSSTVIYLGTKDDVIGYIVIGDELKGGTKEAIANLRKQGITSLIMLTGDRKEVASEIASALSLTDVKAELLPEEKLNALEELLDKESKTAYVGDGINDAPSLMRAKVGISMGGIGSDAAIEASDVVIMNDDLEKIVTARKIAKKTHLIVQENIIFSLAIKGIVIVLSIIGLTNMWLAIFADVGVSLIAVINAMRTLYTGRK